MLYRGSFKVRDRQIFFMGKMVADFNDSFYTANELIDMISGYDEELFVEFVAENSKKKKKIKPENILVAFAEHLGRDTMPDILKKWMCDYGYDATKKGYRKFDDDFHSKKLTRKIVDADVKSMSDDDVMRFVRKNKRHNIEVWHELRMQIRRINDPKDHWFAHCNQPEERKLAYRYAAGRIAGMESEELDEMMEIAMDPWRR